MSSLPTYNECTQSSSPDYKFADKPQKTPSSSEFPFDLVADPESAISIPFDMESFESNLFLSPYLTSRLLYDSVPDAATPSTLPSSDEASPSCVADDLTLPTYSSRSSPSPHIPTVHMSEVESEPHTPPIVEYTPKRTSPYKARARDITHNPRTR